MSIVCLRKLNVKFLRQSLILTKYVPPPLVGALRHCKIGNNLFEMVRKRSLEARTKTQPAKFPHQTPYENSNQTDSTPKILKTPLPPNLTPKNPMRPRSSSPHHPKTVMASTSSDQKKFSSTKADDCVKPAKKTKCENITLLDGSDCNVGAGGKCGGGAGDRPPGDRPPGDRPPGDRPPAGKKGADKRAAKTEPAKTEPAEDGDKSKERGDINDGKDKKKLLTLLALGAGGLLWWLLSRGKKSKEKSTAVVPCTSPKKEEEEKPPARVGGILSCDLPKHIPYLLVGGGTASFSAFRAIKSNDPKAKVLMITNEERNPYMRPPLSKELWYSAKEGEIKSDYSFKQWTGQERSLYFEPDQFFLSPQKLMENVNGGIAVAHGFTVKKIDPDLRVATLADGCEISYDQCLIATGCSPKSLPVFDNASKSVKEKVMVYRTPEDFEQLKKLADEKKSITIIGNGFIGSELACSLANYSKERGVKIYQVFQETGNMSKVLPDYLSKWTTRKVEALGVCVIPNTSVREVRRDEALLQLTLNNGKTLLTDIAVVCVGCEANTSIAAASNLEVDKNLGGFVVNAELEARRNLYVAGDVCCFFDPLLGRRRVEHHDHSVVSGRLAGENMVGKKKFYNHQSMFWSDLGPEIGYEGIGLVDACLPTVGVFAIPSEKSDRKTDNLAATKTDDIESKSGKDLKTTKCDPNDDENYGRGVIFYMKEDKIVGVLLWNLFNRISLARTIINQNQKYDDLNEVAKLFEIHS